MDCNQSLTVIENYVKCKVYTDIQEHIKSVKAVRNPNALEELTRSAVCITITMNPGIQPATALYEQRLRMKKYRMEYSQQYVGGIATWDTNGH